MTIGGIVRNMDPPRYTTSQAAELVGRSADTLRRWRANSIYRIPEKEKFGKIYVYLYTDEDIVAMRKIVNTIHPGPRTGT